MGFFDRLFKKPEPSVPAPAAAAPSVSHAMRDTLYGDRPVELWPPDDTLGNSFPWDAFIAARKHLAAARIDEAKACWRRVAEAPGLESRQYAQAWHFLRQHGEQAPAEIAKKVYGVVVEVGMPKGLDLLAAYPDGHARYYNFAGSGVVWEHPDASLDPLIGQVMEAAVQVVAQIGPWGRERPGPPPVDSMRLSFLTPSGLHFGQAPINTLAADPIGGKMVHLASQLMQALIAKDTRVK